MKKISFLILSASLFLGLTSMKQINIDNFAIVLSDKAFDYKLDKTSHDFGTITEGDKVETSFTITNVGKSPIMFKDAQVGCGCTIPEYSKEPLMPGKSTKVKVGFNSASKSGQQDKDVRMITDNGEIILNFKCFVNPKPPIDPVTPGIKLEK